MNTEKLNIIFKKKFCRYVKPLSSPPPLPPMSQYCSISVMDTPLSKFISYKVGKLFRLWIFVFQNFVLNY